MGEFDGGVEFLLQQFARREGGQILGDMDAGLAEFEEFDLFLFFSGAKDEAERGFLAGLLLVFGQPAEVEFHLAFVFGFEVAEFEVDGDEPPQGAVVEKEVEVEVVGVDGDAFLASEEGEAAAEFEQEGFDFPEDGVFDILFKVAVAQTEEVEDVGIAEDEGGGEPVFGAQGGEFGAGDVFGLLRDGGALESMESIFARRVRTLQFSMRHISA